MSDAPQRRALWHMAAAAVELAGTQPLLVYVRTIQGNKKDIMVHCLSDNLDLAEQRENLATALRAVKEEIATRTNATRH